MRSSETRAPGASARGTLTVAAALVAAACVAAVSAVSPQEAQAHGPTRRKVEETVTVNASPDKVWTVMGNFQDMSWLPGVKSTVGTGGNSVDPKDEGKGAHRTITLDSGGQIAEGLYKYDSAEHTYSYRIEKVDVHVLPVNDYSSTIKVEPGADGKGATVTWRGAFYRGYMNNDPPPELSDEASQAAVRKIYQTGLANLKKKVEAGS